MTEDIIKGGKAVGQPLEAVHESIVEFKMLSDRTVYQVLSERNKEVMVEISGYDLQIKFNLEHINSVQDIEAATGGLTQLFREIITEQLLKHKQKDD